MKQTKTHETKKQQINQKKQTNEKKEQTNKPKEKETHETNISKEPNKQVHEIQIFLTCLFQNLELKQQDMHFIIYQLQ